MTARTDLSSITVSVLFDAFVQQNLDVVAPVSLPLFGLCLAPPVDLLQFLVFSSS
jgi:hypothetical protein